MWIDYLIGGLLLTAVTVLIIRSVRRRKAGRSGCACCGSGGCAACVGCGQATPQNCSGYSRIAK